MKPLMLPIIAVFWMTQAASGQALDMRARIAELAAGMDDFAPVVEELPLDQIADDFDVPEGDAPSAERNAPGVTADPAPQAEPLGPVASVAVIPKGWEKHSLLGLSFAAPADWQQMTKPDDDDELGFGSVDMKEKRVLAVGIEYHGPGKIDDFEGDMEELPEAFSKDLSVDLTGAEQEFSYPDPIIALDGRRILRKKFVLRKDDFFVYAEFFYKEDVNERGGTDGLSLMSVNMPEAEVAPIIEQIVRTVSLEAAPLPETQVGLNGLVNYMMPLPKGWKRQFIGSEAINFISSPTFSAGLSVDTGYRARDSWGSDDEFEGAPEISTGEIFGQPATIKKGLMKEAQMQVGMRFVKGLHTVYLLDMCLTNGDQIVVSLYAAESWLESTGYDSLLETISLTLPDDAITCPAANVAASPVAPPATAPTISASGWTEYNNSRFGTSVRYPTSHFQLAGQPPANDDGRSFVSLDGQAEMLVWAGYNALEQTAQQIMEEVRDGLPGASIISQQVDVKDFEITLQDGGLMVHQRSEIDDENIVHNVLVQYPEVQNTLYAPMARAMIDSLTNPWERAAEPPQQAPLAPPVSAGMEQAFWQTIQGSAHAADFDAYLQQWPKGVYAAQARQRLAELATPSSQAQSDPKMELAFWQSIQNSSDPAMYQAYLNRWPNGTFAVLAKLNQQRLSAPVPSSPAPVIKPAPAARVAYYTPARNTAERQAVMDAAREPMWRELGQKVIFLVKTLRTDGQWYFLMAEPLQPNGKKLDWYSTPYADDWAKDAMSDVVMVLMRRQGSGWQVVDYVIGPTDVHWYNWIDGYGLPERLFTPG
ncbi:MAG: hypothetical protein V7695_18865 [Sulfitobacter sp.]